jgi:diguanylate cyclase (GGDEF)-like protein
VPLELTFVRSNGGHSDKPELHVFASDVRNRKASPALARHTRTDAATGLANRQALVERLEQELHALHRRSASLGVMYIEIEGLEAEAREHAAGAFDRAMAQLAQRLRKAVRPSDLLAREGPGTLLLVAAGLNSEEQLEELALRLRAAAFEAAHGDSQPLSLRCAATLESSPDCTAEALLRRAQRLLRPDQVAHVELASAAALASREAALRA